MSDPRKILSKFKMKDHPGKIPVKLMREMFEAMVQGTSVFNKLNLEIRAIDDGSFYYADQETDSMWIGFSLGLRMAERIEGNGHTLQDAQTRGIKWVK